METAIHNSSPVFISPDMKPEENVDIKTQDGRERSIEMLTDSKPWAQMCSYITEIVEMLETSLDKAVETELDSRIVGQKYQAIRTATYYLKHVRDLPRELRELTLAE